MSEDVHVVVTGDAGSLDAGLLALSVSVEGVLKVGFPDLATAGVELLKQIASAEKLVSKSNLESSFKKRLGGSLSTMYSPRAKDKLLALVEGGFIRKELMDRWARIRNSSVHASDIDPAEISKLYGRYQSVLTLFNELVFLTIGYTGEYTDYSVPNWPMKTLEQKFRVSPEGSAGEGRSATEHSSWTKIAAGIGAFVTIISLIVSVMKNGNDSGD